MKVAPQTFSPSIFTSVPSYHPEFPNLVVIKGLRESVWMPSQPPPTHPPSHCCFLKRSRLLPAADCCAFMKQLRAPSTR